MSAIRGITTLAFLSVFVTGCVSDRVDADVQVDTSVTMDVMQPALASITVEDILRRTSALSADSMEGRLPARSARRAPCDTSRNSSAHSDSRPATPMVPTSRKCRWLESRPRSPRGSRSRDGMFLSRGAATTSPSPLASLSEVKVEDSELVFVGYGVVAPEHGWDDYKDVDVKGKAVVMLVNDPPIRLAGDTVLDQSMFRGEAMTYYGRWTYKYEIAAEKGAGRGDRHPRNRARGLSVRRAVGRLRARELQHQVRGRQHGSGCGAGLDVRAGGPQSPRSDGARFRPAEGPGGREGLSSGGARCPGELRPRATATGGAVAERGGQAGGNDPVIPSTSSTPPTGITWAGTGRSRATRFTTARIDNASGVATVIEIAEAFTELSRRPDRSILFLAVTAEEQGLLGAKYYAENPLYPLAKTVANVNVDGINQWGRTEDIVVVGRGNSTLDDALADAAATQGRVLEPDPETEKASSTGPTSSNSRSRVCPRSSQLRHALPRQGFVIRVDQAQPVHERGLPWGG